MIFTGAVEYLKKLFKSLALFAVVGAFLAFLVVWSGLYNVAASKGHFSWTRWLLEFGMASSVRTHSGGDPVPDLADMNLLKLGAGHYQAGCAPCHGSPYIEANSLFRHMLPSPPRLEEPVQAWSDQELHWLVFNGIKYAGMPAWSGAGREEEVWSVVAFLRALSLLNQSEYVAMAAGNSSIKADSASEIITQGQSTSSVSVCGRCHETESAPPTSSLVPRLAGQSVQYLYQSLIDYKTGQRESGFMEPVTAELDEALIDELASFYAGLAAPGHSKKSALSAEQLDNGQRLALAGDPSAKIPACSACHRLNGRADYPKLAGQSADYIAAQLRLWRAGGRQQTARGELMATIALRLQEHQIEEVAGYFAELPDFPPAETAQMPDSTRVSAPVSIEPNP